MIKSNSRLPSIPENPESFSFHPTPWSLTHDLIMSCYGSIQKKCSVVRGINHPSIREEVQLLRSLGNNENKENYPCPDDDRVWIRNLEVRVCQELTLLWSCVEKEEKYNQDNAANNTAWGDPDLSQPDSVSMSALALGIANARGAALYLVVAPSTTPVLSSIHFNLVRAFRERFSKRFPLCFEVDLSDASEFQTKKVFDNNSDVFLFRNMSTVGQLETVVYKSLGHPCRQAVFFVHVSNQEENFGQRWKHFSHLFSGTLHLEIPKDRKLSHPVKVGIGYQEKKSQS